MKLLKMPVRMKKYLYMFVLMAGLSCQKNGTGTDNNCTNFIQASPSDLLVTQQQMDTIVLILNKYKVDYSNLQFYQYSNNGFYLISGYQFVNHLKLFTDEITYLLSRSDTLLHISGTRIINIDKPATQRLNINGVRALYFNTIEKDSIYRSAGQIIDSCLDFEFGYYNKNVHNLSKPKDFTTAWKVNPHRSDHPLTYINDINDSILDYNNGIYFK